MRYAIISDIHSNLEALEAALEELKRLNADRIICLGDITGYNANPNEVTDILIDADILSIKGNHDERITGLKEPKNFNPVAMEAVYWTRKTLNEKNNRYLASLPDRIKINEQSMGFHGTYAHSDAYILDTFDAASQFCQLMEKAPEIHIAFFGHTHVPVVYEYDGKETVTAHPGAGELRLKQGYRYLINPGSLGQPRDGNTDASFLLYDDSGLINFHRVRYDVSKTAEKILAAGLPEFLAKRLLLGR